MRLFSRLRPWQKSAAFGFLFVVFISLVYTLVLVAMEFIFEARGLPHFCYLVFSTKECNMVDAIFSRLGFFMVMVLVFGIPVSVVTGLLGYIYERIVYKDQ